MGVSEVVIFDPEASVGVERSTWQIFRRKKKTGRLERVLRTDRETIRSEQLRCWLTVVGRGGEQRIRIARAANGRDLYPTDAEAAEAARNAEETALAGEREARAALRAETAARSALEAKLKRLEAKGRRGRPSRP